MVLPSVDNKSIKKTTEDPSPTESKLNIIDSDNFLSWIVMKKAHATLLLCPHSKYQIFSNSMNKNVKNKCYCKSRTLATIKRCFITF